MGGETPGAAAHAKRLAARRALLAPQVRSADVYYRSGQVSAIGGEGNGIATSPQRPEDKSAEKYYAEGGSDRRKLAKQRQRSVSVGAMAARTHIETAEQIRTVLAGAIEKIIGGEESVVITVPANNIMLLNRTRAAIDLATTREDITEDQARAIKLRYLTPTVAAKPSAQPKVMVPLPTPPATAIEQKPFTMQDNAEIVAAEKAADNVTPVEPVVEALLSQKPSDDSVLRQVMQEDDDTDG